MTFNVHASGSTGNLYTVADGDSTLAIECGIAYKDMRRALGFQTSKLAGALVSHSHGDHARAAAEAMRAGIDVYCSAGTAEACGLTGHRVHHVRSLEQFSVGAWTVLPFDTVHDAPEPLGFMVIGPSGGRLLYLTDSAYCPYRFEGLTIIAVEANFSMDILRQRMERGDLPPAHYARVIRSHMSIERCIELLQANDLSRVAEIHLLHLSNGNSDAVEFKRRVERATGRPARVAEERTTP